MSEDTKKVFAVLSPISALLGWFAFGIVFEPLALVFGIIGASSKEVGYKVAGIVGAIVGGVLLIVVFAMLTLLVNIKY